MPVALPSAAIIRRFYTVLFLAAAILILATLLSDLEWPISTTIAGRQLDLKLEGNVAVWFSSVVLFMAAAAAGGIAVSEGAGTGQARRFWTVVAVFLLGLSVDETAQIHEGVGRRFTHWFGTVPYLTEGGLPVFAWLIALLPFIVWFVVAILGVLRTHTGLPGRTRGLIAAGMACWVGVLVAEFTQAQMVRWGMKRSVQGVIEEGLELSGAVLFLVGFVEVLRHRSKNARALSATG